MQYRRFQAEKLTAIGKRIRCNVQHPHDFGRLAKIECSTAGFPDHGLRHASDGGCSDVTYGTNTSHKSHLSPRSHSRLVGGLCKNRRTRTKLSNTKKRPANPPAFSNSLRTVFLRSCSRLTLFWLAGAENQLINFRLNLDDVVRLNVATQQFLSQRILQKPLNRPTHRARTIDGIVAFLDK